MEDKTNNRLGINHIKRVKNTNDFYPVQWNFRRFLVNWHPEFKELAFEKAIRAIESLMRKRETNSNYVWNLSVSGKSHIKVICENGDSWITGVTCDIQEARKYFVNAYKVYENLETGEESKTKIISVIDLKVRKDLLYCLQCEGKAIGIGIDELDLFIELEGIDRSKLEQWEVSKKDILEKWEEYVRLILGYTPSNG